jgi:hypothetical protein
MHDDLCAASTLLSSSPVPPPAQAALCTPTPSVLFPRIPAYASLYHLDLKLARHMYEHMITGLLPSWVSKAFLLLGMRFADEAGIGAGGVCDWVYCACAGLGCWGWT